ncbi:unnamed protein product [Periconia digitata]|uniref:Uncharacterized protein n=1 Tax=Periconia digitata TaxID=1303443 RepID=A0A9W4UI28_9PLEO|nr:unnamed protein product [Periconia digitata]
MKMPDQLHRSGETHKSLFNASRAIGYRVILQLMACSQTLPYANCVCWPPLAMTPQVYSVPVVLSKVSCG